MAGEANVLQQQIGNVEIHKKENTTKSTEKASKIKENLFATAFLVSLTGISTLFGFGSALALARKRDPKYFSEGLGKVNGVYETGAMLALRALGWGTFYAVSGCSCLFYGIWKLSGATNAEEFRQKMGSILPRIPKNDPPQSRTEFEGLTDLLTYISEDWGKKNVHKRFKI